MATSSKYPGVKRLPSGGIEYRGKKFAGFNKPRKSDRPEKKGMVLAKEGDTIKLIHYGAKGYGHNYSPTARASFKSRHAKNINVARLSVDDEAQLAGRIESYDFCSTFVKFCRWIAPATKKF